MCSRCSDLVLEAAETHLHDRNFADGEGRRLFPSRTDIASAALLAICGSVSQNRVARARSLRVNFQQFLGRLPLPTMILRWNLKPIYQNQAACEFCAVWEKGPEEAKRTKANSPVPVRSWTNAVFSSNVGWMRNCKCAQGDKQNSQRNGCNTRARQICERQFN